MKTLIRKYFIPFVVVFAGTLLVIVGLSAAGKISPSEMGYALGAVCSTAIILLTLLLYKTTKEAQPATQPSESGQGPTARKRILRSIRTCKVAIAVMLVIFVYAFWATKNDPLLLRIVGAVINLAITSAFVIALKTQRAKLR